ncbi:MAG: hypothetical protein KJ592_02555 [Nanoarchaeota archaeon]|nr:hypothetical protein [Nanoarchaeota archaeon]
MKYEKTLYERQEDEANERAWKSLTPFFLLLGFSAIIGVIAIIVVVSTCGK